MLLLFMGQALVGALVVSRTWRDVEWALREVGANSAAAERLAKLAPGPRSEPLPTGVWRAFLGGIGEACDGECLDAVADARDALKQRVFVARRLARIASACTMLIVLIELSLGLAGGTGLESLQAGLPQQLAIRNSITSLTIGGVTLTLQTWVMRRVAERVGKHLQRVRTRFVTDKESDAGTTSGAGPRQ